VPFGDLQVLPEGFDVRNEMPGGVVACLCVWARVAAATLVEKDYAVVLGVEELCVRLGDVATWTAVEVDNWARLACVSVVNGGAYLAFRPSYHTARSTARECRPL